jgi:hypothetical protein
MRSFLDFDVPPVGFVAGIHGVSWIVKTRNGQIEQRKRAALTKTVSMFGGPFICSLDCFSQMATTSKVSSHSWNANHVG